MGAELARIGLTACCILNGCVKAGYRRTAGRFTGADTAAACTTLEDIAMSSTFPLLAPMQGTEHQQIAGVQLDIAACRRGPRQARDLPGRVPLVNRHQAHCGHRFLHACPRRVPGAWSNPHRVSRRLSNGVRRSASSGYRARPRRMGRGQRARGANRVRFRGQDRPHVWNAGLPRAWLRSQELVTSHGSFKVQGDHWIHSHGAPRGNVARGQRGQQE